MHSSHIALSAQQCCILAANSICGSPHSLFTETAKKSVALALIWNDKIIIPIILKGKGCFLKIYPINHLTISSYCVYCIYDYTFQLQHSSVNASFFSPHFLIAPRTTHTDLFSSSFTWQPWQQTFASKLKSLNLHSGSLSDYGIIQSTLRNQTSSGPNTYRHTHIHTYKFVLVWCCFCLCVCTCVYTCMYACVCVKESNTKQRQKQKK